MASLRGVVNKSPGAWQVGKPYPDGSIYMKGGKWSDPDTIRQPAQGVAMLFARRGNGQVLGIELGGVYAVDPPEEPAP